MSDVEYRWKALIAGSLLTLNLGSIHAFSVFVAPFEALYDATRGNVSLIYSLAHRWIEALEIFRRFGSPTVRAWRRG